MLTMGELLPHPPIIVEGVGRPEDRAKADATIRAMREVNELWGADPPETIVVFTPHGTVYQDAIIIYDDVLLSGGLHQFGLNRVWKWETDRELAEAITKRSRGAGLPVYRMEQQQAAGRQFPSGLDHGVLVPLSFFSPDWAEKMRLVVIPLSFLPWEELYQFGAMIGEAIGDVGRKVGIVASGDLSHALSKEAPSGYHPQGAVFDAQIMRLLKEAAVPEVMKLDPVWVEQAAECGFRSILMLLGTMDRIRFRTEVHSYEGPFGVGYGVATFHPEGEKFGFVRSFFQARSEKVEKRRFAESPLVKYARNVVETYVKGQPAPVPQEVEIFAGRRAGVFVSLKKHGQLRGCIGTIEPTQNSILEEVRHNAVAAATRDPRFEPVSEAELMDLTYSVDILETAEPVSGPDELDPKRYGVIVKQGIRKGLLLPDLEGVDTPAKQVAIAKQKAGIAVDESVELERFEVVRYI